jgi:hypothetical protein
MSRPRRDVTGRVRSIGGLVTVRDEQCRAVPAIDGQLDKDRRRVLLRIEPSGWERDRPGDVEATARKLRVLAETSAGAPARSRAQGRRDGPVAA